MNKPLCIIAGISLLAACGGRQSQVDRAVENGVEVVLNHLEPYALKGQPSQIDLKEETRIDFEKAEYSGLGLKEPDFAEADPQGNIYVVEQFSYSEYFIYKFSPDGKFIKKFGKKGQGPGEIQGIYSFVINKSGHILISDRSASKLLEFDADGNFVQETKAHYVLREAIPLENGNYLAVRNSKDSSESRGWYLCIFGPDFNEVKSLLHESPPRGNRNMRY